MNNNLAPTFKKLFGSYWVLWYKKSNIYSVVDTDFKTILYQYFDCASLDDFKTKIASVSPSLDYYTIAQNLQTYLEQCNAEYSLDKHLDSINIDSKCSITKTYSINGKVLQINFSSDTVQKTIHPSIAHLETNYLSSPDVIFDLFLDNDNLCLLKNKALIKTVPKRDYHKIQGKFAMELFCFIYNNKEEDWLGTFHGCTIADGENAILFIGESGKGKSTLSALLTAQDFELVADDVSPMLAYDSCIYHNPSAISIKKGAFNLLKPLINDFDLFPEVIFNKAKGIIKYVPCKKPLKDKYPCKAIIIVNYTKNAETKLDLVSIKEALETLVPESWLSPNPDHAEYFLDWLSKTPIYKLTYSNTESVTEEISKCFKQLREQ